MPKRHKKNSPKSTGKKFRAVAKLHATITILLLFSYCLGAILLDPSFLARDVKQKYVSAANIPLSMRIIGPPEKPAINVSSSCTKGIASVRLSWNKTRDTETYSIYRNGSILVAGVEENQYNDESALPNSQYVYKVSAIGPLGLADSEEIIVGTRNCPVLPEPFCKISSMGAKAYYSGGRLAITLQKPKFSGSSNIPHARIKITLHSRVINGTTIANENGYWEWTVPEKIDPGNHSINILATDPLNPEISASTILEFRVIEEGMNDQKNESDKDKQIAIQEAKTDGRPDSETQNQQQDTEKSDAGFYISSSVKKTADQLYAGNDLDFETSIDGKDIPEEIAVLYSILDQDGKTIVENRETLNTKNTFLFNGSIHLPRLIKSGLYFLSITAVTDGFTSNYTVPISVTQEPVLVFPGGIELTLLDMINKINWFIMIMLIILTTFILLLELEKFESTQAIIKVTEKILERRGFFTPRKEVSS